MQKCFLCYLDEVETLDEVDTDDDVDTELDVDTLERKFVACHHIKFSPGLKDLLLFDFR